MKPEYSNQIQQDFVIDAYSHAFNQLTGEFDFTQDCKKDRDPFVSALALERKPAKKTNIGQRRPNATLLFIFGEQSPPLYIQGIANMYGVSREQIKLDVNVVLRELHANAPEKLQQQYDLDELIAAPIPKLRKSRHLSPSEVRHFDSNDTIACKLANPDIDPNEAQSLLASADNSTLRYLRKKGEIVCSITTLQTLAWGKANPRKSGYAYNLLYKAGIPVTTKESNPKDEKAGFYRYVLGSAKDRAIQILKENPSY